MSIESFHRSLHCTSDAEPMLAKLRGITKIEDPAQIHTASDEDSLAGWIPWVEQSPAQNL